MELRNIIFREQCKMLSRIEELRRICCEETVKRELNNWPCDNLGILQWLKFGIILGQMQEESARSSGATHVQDQTSTFPSRRTLLALQFWIAAKYTEWHWYCKKRQQFKELGIILSGTETWYYRDNKEREWNEKRIVEYVDSTTSLPK